MAVPEEIRKIPRPKNTVVVAYGRNKDKYAVKQRIGCKSVNGRKIPIDGPTIGHIINGTYVEDVNLLGMAVSECDFKRWADVELCCNLSQDILTELRRYYNESEAIISYLMAVLRATDPGINDYEFQDAYDDTWLSVRYPDVELSRETVNKHINQLGRTCSRISGFMTTRARSTSAEHRFCIGGILKSDENECNIFYNCSKLAPKKESKNKLVIYTFDIDTGEPICSKVYPENTIDISALDDFIKTTDVDKGIIISDRSYSYHSARKTFETYPNLHLLLSLKRTVKCIEKYTMYEYNSNVPGSKNLVTRKERICDDIFLYSFRDTERAFEEEIAWISNQNDCAPQKLDTLRKQFGSIVFISNTDIDPEIVYKAYEERLDVERMFKLYWDILMFDQTNVHDDWSVVGTEFINFLSIIMTHRLKKTFAEVPLLKNMPYIHSIKKLKRASMIRDDNGEWKIGRITSEDHQILIALGLVPCVAEIKNPRGRPKKTSKH